MERAKRTEIVHMANDWARAWGGRHKPPFLYDQSKCHTNGKLRKCVTEWSKVTCPRCLKRNVRLATENPNYVTHLKNTNQLN